MANGQPSVASNTRDRAHMGDIMIKYVLGFVLCVALIGSSVACGGGDAAPESKTAAVQDAGALKDFGRDIDQMAAGVSDAAGNFADDLFDLARPKPARERVDALAQELSKCLKGRTISGAQRDALAGAFVAAASGQGVPQARSIVESNLSAAGVAADAVLAVANATAQLGAR
jgi:hypothetical protein